jgi:exosortase
MLDRINIMATNEGSTIFLEGAVVTVGNACSGLRSLISLIFLGMIFAAITQLTPPRKAILFISSIPIALVANIVRVFLLCVIANRWGGDKIKGLVHDASGYLIFVVAFLLLYATLRILEIGQSASPPPAPAAGGEPPALAAGQPKEDHHA